MSDDAKKRGVDAADLHDNHPPPYYGTFQGVANYYPPQNQSQSQPILGFPHPLPPPDPRYYYQGYNHALPVYAVAEGRPLREHRLRCCGLGLGWLLFITGFFLGGVPWYIGAFILLCIQMDYREKPGLIACTVAMIGCQNSICSSAGCHVDLASCKLKVTPLNGMQRLKTRISPLS